jgi:hypothetical protein
MELKNEYIVIGIIIIITVFFIINYDVYVLAKNEPLCKPVYVTKKIINDKMIKKLKNPKESFAVYKNKNKKLKIKNEEIQENRINEENEINYINQENKDIKEILIKESCNDENIREENIEDENINHNKNIIRKKIIINNILNILPKIPTRLKDEEIHFIIRHISEIYLASTSMPQFYNNVNNSNKITSDNSNYVKLILYLIDNFDTSLPIDLEPKINKPENKKIIKAENDDNIFFIPNGNSPIQSRMMQQASFIRQ